MCCTFKPAKLTNTTVLAGTIPGSTRRFLHYRNTAESIHGDESFRTGRRSLRSSPALPKAWDFGGAGSLAAFDNCLAFPLYGMYDSIKSLESESANKALTAVDEAIRSLYPKMASFSLDATRGAVSKGLPNGVKILVTKLYTSIVSEDTALILKVLEERGASRDLLDAANAKLFGKAYPNTPFSLNLFSNGAAKKGGLLFTFEPLPGFESVYVIPTLDGHGRLDFAEDVKLDHIIAVGTPAQGRKQPDFLDLNHVGTFGSADSGDAVEVAYHGADTAATPEVAECLPKTVIGVELKGYLANGDIIVDKASADKGIWNARRVAPHGLTAAESKLVEKPITIPGPSA